MSEPAMAERIEDAAALAQLAAAALRDGTEEDALPRVKRGAERLRSSLLWQWAGLLERALDEHEQALASYGRAAALDPRDPTIAHGRARVAHEAGVPSLELYERALRLDPRNPDILLGVVASLFASGLAERAENLLELTVSRTPGWTTGHSELAQLRAVVGKRELATASIEQALRLHPQAQELWTTLFSVLLRSGRFAELADAVARARKAGVPEAMLLPHEAVAAAEQRQTERADALFAKVGSDSRAAVEVWRIRHLLRTGRVTEAVGAADEVLTTPNAPAVWPYAAAAWRLSGDSRWEWLEADERFISVIDLGDTLPEIHRLERSLRSIHLAKGEFLDQSVRGGTQTDGPLFCRIDPEIRALRSAVVAAVEAHIRALPPRDPAHPLLAGARNRRVRFSGSWSILLRAAGYHVNHVHPQGWISSALYIRLPERSPGEAENAGWLTLGEPEAELGLDLKPFRDVEPKVGRLVLFPSYMWHGTRPFEQGERMTVAFDVRRPGR